jgi:hypothetical protein
MAALGWAAACAAERRPSPPHPARVEPVVVAFDSLNSGLVVAALSGVTWRGKDDETFRRRAATLARGFGFAVRASRHDAGPCRRCTLSPTAIPTACFSRRNKAFTTNGF